MKKTILISLLSFTLIATIYANNINTVQPDSDVIIGLKESDYALADNNIVEISKFTSPLLGITFNYISSGSLYNPERVSIYRYDNIVCLGEKKELNNLDQKIGCIEIFNKKPQAGSYVKENNIWRKINLNKEDWNGESELIVTKVNRVRGKKTRYLTYDMEGLSPGLDYSWIKTIKKTKTIQNK